jgi:hypothetical protein
VRGTERIERHQVDRADLARLEHLADRLDHRRMLVVVRGEEHALGGRGVVEHRPRVGGTRRDRLLAEHVQAVLERGVGDGGVIARGCRDIDEVQPAGLGGQQRLGIGIDPGLRENLTRLVPAGGADVRHRNDLDLVAGSAIGTEISGDMPVLGNESKPDEGTL